MQVKYAKLDPFNVSFYDMKEKCIYIDKAFKGTPIEGTLISHEEGHEGKHILYEHVSDADKSIFWDVLKIKPLHAIQFLFPFVLGRRKDGSWIFKIDPLGLLILAAIIVAVSYVTTYTSVGCEKIPNFGGAGYTYANCQRCTVFGGCDNISAIEAVRYLSAG